MRHAIFMIFDDRYSSFAKRCLASLHDNYPDHPEVLVFYDGYSMNTIGFLRNIPGVTVIQPDYSFMDYSGLNLGPIMTTKVYFRFILWTNKFDDYETILHLDADTLILKPFPELFENERFFGVRDYTPFGKTLFRPKYHTSWSLKRKLKRDGIPNHSLDMMNAGIFVIPKKYRGNSQFDNLMEVTKRYSKYVQFADQSIISLWCYKNGIEITRQVKYNFQLAFLLNPEVYSDISLEGLNAEEVKIIHYSWWKDQDTINRFRDFSKLLDYAKISKNE